MKCCLIFPLLFAVALTSPGSGSGGGSGGTGGMLFTDCPDAPLRSVGFVGVGHSTARAQLTGLSVRLPTFVAGEDLVTSLTPSRMLPSLTLVIDQMTEVYTLEVATDEVSVGEVVQVDVRLSIVDMMMVVLDTCAFTVEATYVSEGLCDRTQLPRLPAATILQSIHLTLDFSLDQINSNTQRLIRDGFAAVLNNFCPQNPVQTCQQCSMTSVCNLFLENCRNFTDQNIILLAIADMNPSLFNGRRRQTGTSGVTVTLAAQVPDGAPQQEGSSVLVPGSTMVEAGQREVGVFTAVTGLAVLDVERNDNTPADRVTFELVAVIVLPIVVCAVVITLIVGIVVVIVVSMILKKKKVRVTVRREKRNQVAPK